MKVSDFADQLGTRFRIFTTDSNSIEVELIEARALPGEGRPSHLAPREPFSLIFRGREGISIPQKIYKMEHETLGSFELFLVPIEPSKGETRFEAVFN